MKYCSKCGTKQSLDNFYGRSSVCSSCNHIQQRSGRIRQLDLPALVLRKKKLTEDLKVVEERLQEIFADQQGEVAMDYKEDILNDIDDTQV